MKTINDKFTNLPVSRQRKYQLRKRAAGKCEICGTQPIYKNKYCVGCCEKHGVVGSKGFGMSVGEIHFLNHFKVPVRQIVVNGMIIDGIKGKVIYEYLGDYWHGNPNVFDPSKLNLRAGKTYGELYKETFARLHKLTNGGYFVKYVWEKDWNQFRQKKTDTLNIVTLSPKLRS